MESRHMYYSNPAKINLKALQTSAQKIADGGQHVMIHHHSASESCNSKKHEEFAAKGQN